MEGDPAKLLREHGLQVTAQRVAVISAVHACPHSSAERVADYVRAQIGSVSKQAVYDALGALTDKGLIRRLQPAGSPTLYDPRTDEHHHAVCTSCGRTVDVDCAPETEPSLSAADDSGFAIDTAEVVFWGTCPDCKSTRTTPTDS